MKKIHNFIMLLFVAFAVASCAEEEIIENKVVGKPGDEVKFSLSLGNGSRTVYGDEINNTFPIYWVDGDKVQVYSPDASSSRNNAEYKVILPKGENGVVVEKPDYADDLEKTGDYGVQWGVGYEYKDENGETHTGVHDFYSIYPSGNYEFSKDADKKNMIASRLRVKTVQEISYVDGTYTHDMSNCLMYATTPKVDMEDGVVNLSYHPLSTVLWFDVTAFKDNTLQDAQQTNFMITGIDLEYTGTEGAIAGAFSYDVDNGNLVDFEEPYNKISVKLYDKSGTQELSHTVKAGEPLNFPIFLAPSDLDLNNLKITIHTDNGTFTKTLSGTSNFKPGKIHKITLPKLSKTSEGWDVSKWMTYIPRNVYLSEISIPGSWNSLNVDCQTNTDLNTQYKNGVRAFHLDARYNGIKSGGSTYNPSYTITDLGVATGGSGKTYDVDTNDTDVASNGKVMNSTTTFETYLGTIVQCVQPDEYMVVFVTFAQNSATKKSMSWEDAVVTACKNINNNTEIDGEIVLASEINSNSVVGDVLGKVIVIINTESESIDNPDPCFYTHVPLELTDKTCSGTYELNNVEKNSGITLKASQCQVEFEKTNTITNNNDGDRGFLPKPAERKEQLNSIINWSKENYNNKDNYEHNAWIYLGIGGYQGAYDLFGDLKSSSGSYEDVASDYNNWINDKVTEMGTEVVSYYYPVGIILMNNAVSYSGTTVKNILLLNNKYRLQYDPKKPVDYDPLYWTPGTGDGENVEGGDAI